MQLVQIGDIRDSIERTFAHCFPYIEASVLHGILEEILPERGLIISASKCEIKDDKNLAGCLYNDVEVTLKEAKENGKRR